MKFGWLTLSASPAPEADRERIADQIALAEAAEAAGFSDVWLTEHYFTGESVYCDALTFAAAPRHAHGADAHRLRRGAGAVPPPGAARNADRAARQPLRRAHRHRRRQGHRL